MLSHALLLVDMFGLQTVSMTMTCSQYCNLMSCFMHLAGICTEAGSLLAGC